MFKRLKIENNTSSNGNVTTTYAKIQYTKTKDIYTAIIVRFKDNKNCIVSLPALGKTVKFDLDTSKDTLLELRLSGAIGRIIDSMLSNTKSDKEDINTLILELQAEQAIIDKDILFSSMMKDIDNIKSILDRIGDISIADTGMCKIIYPYKSTILTSLNSLKLELNTYKEEIKNG